MRKAYFLLIFIFVHYTLFAQNQTFYGFIPSYLQTGFISKKFDYNIFLAGTASSIKRTFNSVEYPPRILQLYFQPSFIYKYSPDLNFAVSVTYNYQRETPIEPLFYEFIPWQQVIYGHKFFTKGTLTHRLRLEERFIKYPETARKMAMRVIYEIGYIQALEGRTIDPNEFYINVFNEFYLSPSNPQGLPEIHFFSENWSYIGIGYETGKMGRVEIGPLFQASFKKKSEDRRNLLLLQISWITKFNFLSNKK